MGGQLGGQFELRRPFPICFLRVPFVGPVQRGAPQLLLSLCDSGEVLEDHMHAHEEVRAFMTDPVLQQRLAKYLVLQCFRNSMLEDLHTGISPSSASGEYSDVTVSSPYGVIL